MPKKESPSFQTILFIEEEPQIRRFMDAALLALNYKTKHAASGVEALAYLNTLLPDLIILDLELPDMEGIDIINQVREKSDLPIIVLSARGGESMEIQALDAGADDYLIKPFGVSDLITRIHTALKDSTPVPTKDKIFTLKDLVVDLAQQRTTVGGKEANLTATEFKLLATLIKYGGKVVTHNHLLKEVWGNSALEQGHYLRIYMQYLRNKLGDDPVYPKYILTETGIGYRLKVR